MAVEATVGVHINAKPEVVWKWVADIERHADWSPKAYRVERLTGEPNAVGSTYRSVGWVPPNDANHANEVTITEVVPTTRFVLEARDENGTYRSEYDLTPVGGGTQVTFHIVFPEMKGIAAVMVPVLFPIVAKPDFRKRLALLKTRIESTR